jgi:hypothetical protein
MPEFIISKDFPQSEIEFDQRFSNPENAMPIFFLSNDPMDSVEKNAGMIRIESIEIYLFVSAASFSIR